MWIIRFSDLARVIKIDREVLVNPKDSGSSVPLKEHLLALIADQHDMAMQREASVALRFELAQRAVELDHIEMLRRLDLLNHSHEEARQKEATFVGREVYESQAKEHNKWRDEVNATLSARQGRSSVTSGVAGAVGGLALSALFGLIMYIAKVVMNSSPR